uniref:Integral membrane protein n=1 Tax=Streptomyces sp. NBC_00093 TaxID=2975649 RepID=A0AAU2AA05_9ACTN
MGTVVRWARAEWGPLYVAVRGPLLRRRWRALPMTLGAVCLTALVQFTQNQSWGYRFVQNLGAVRAEDPLWLALLRTPLSLFVPALDLPVWGALAQILVVFGIAEICLGWWRALVIAYVATLAGTLYARVGIAVGPSGFLGLPGADAHVVDTGPSAAVVGLAVFLGWRYRAYVTAAAVIVAMVVEVILKDNLAGKEHLAAIVAVLVLCGVSTLRHGRTTGARAGSGSGLPPIRS